MMICILSSATIMQVSADAIVDWYPEEIYVDYQVQVAAPDGGVNFRYGPGVEYNKIFSNMIPNGVILSITQEAQASNGNYWGYTYYNGQYGWVALTQVARYTPPVPTATPTPLPTSTPTPQPTATSIPTPQPTATPAPIPTATSTPAPTATFTPAPTDTPVPTATPVPEEEGLTISYAFLTKLLAVTCVVLIIALTAVILLYKNKK